MIHFLSRLTFYCVAGILISFLLGFLWFITRIPHQIQDTETKTDAIVILTGASGRVETGLELLKEDKAPKLFISGVHPKVSLQEFQRVLAPHIPLEKISLGYSAFNTQGNAYETAQWLKENKIKSIRLVTSSYHMPRSLQELRYTLPKDIKVIPHPVFSHYVKMNDWWRWKGTTRLILKEYIKYLMTALYQKVINE